MVGEARTVELARTFAELARAIDQHGALVAGGGAGLRPDLDVLVEVVEERQLGLGEERSRDLAPYLVRDLARRALPRRLPFGPDLLGVDLDRPRGRVPVADVHRQDAAI